MISGYQLDAETKKSVISFFYSDDIRKPYGNLVWQSGGPGGVFLGTNRPKPIFCSVTVGGKGSRSRHNFKDFGRNPAAAASVWVVSATGITIELGEYGGHNEEFNSEKGCA